MNQRRQRSGLPFQGDGIAGRGSWALPTATMVQAVGLPGGFLPPCLSCLGGDRPNMKASTPLRRVRLDDFGDVLGGNQYPAPGGAEVEELPATSGSAKVPWFLEGVLPAIAQAHGEGTEGLPLDEFPDRCRVHARDGNPRGMGVKRQLRGKPHRMPMGLFGGVEARESRQRNGPGGMVGGRSSFSLSSEGVE